MTGQSEGSWACHRCGRGDVPRIGFSPWAGDFGRRIRAEICLPCWDEWVGLQTRIINEYRLNVLDPGHATAVREQMEYFFKFREPEAGA